MSANKILLLWKHKHTYLFMYNITPGLNNSTGLTARGNKKLHGATSYSVTGWLKGNFKITKFLNSSDEYSGSFDQYYASWWPSDSRSQGISRQWYRQHKTGTMHVCSIVIFSLLLSKIQDMIWHLNTPFIQVFKKKFSMSIRVKIFLPNFWTDIWFGQLLFMEGQHEFSGQVALRQGNKIFEDANSLRAKFFRGNINMYLHFISFLHTDMPKIVEILPRIRPGLTYFIQSISWLLMSWRRKEPRHQQPLYWLS